MQDNYFLNRALKSIENVEYVSFDIFDTLLLRPYLSPKDLFLHLEEIHQCYGFSSERVQAERRARKKNLPRQDIQYDEIYEEIDKRYFFLKDIELAFERKVLYANIEMKMLWDYAIKSEKNIIICSDMYLPKDFLQDVLSKNGYKDFHYLYVSGEIGKTKKTGDLFKHLLNELKITSNNIVHIGDNKKGDFKIPQKMGIKCLLYPQVIQQYLHINHKAKIFSQQCPGLAASVFIALLAKRWQQQKLTEAASVYWQDLGYSYAAPVAAGFTQWIAQQAKLNNIDHVLFVARDGFLLQKFFAKLETNIKHSYLYAPRFLNLICRLDYDADNAVQAQAIVDFFSHKHPELQLLVKDNAWKNSNAYHQFILENIVLFKKYAAQEFQIYKDYLNNLIDQADQLALVDSKTIAFTSQKLVENGLDRKISGFYWSTLLTHKSQSITYHEFIKNSSNQYDSAVFSKNWAFVELLLSSPELPIQSVAEHGIAVYKQNITSNDRLLSQNYLQIVDGASSFISDMDTLFGKDKVFLDGHDLICWINIFCDYPDRVDIQNMSEISIAVDVSHNQLKPLFSVKTPLSTFVTQPLKTIKLLKAAKWRTTAQSIGLSLFKPFKIKFRKHNSLKINLLPYLKWQYFICILKLSSKFKLYFIIGKDEQ